MEIGILNGCTAKLRLLKHGDKCQLEFEIVGGHGGHCDAWNLGMGPRSDIMLSLNTVHAQC